MLASAVALAVTALSIPLTLIPQAYASPVVPTAQPAPDTLGFHLVRTLPTHAVLPLTHTVQSGDTLSGLAVRYCNGNDKDWTGFYHDNRKVIGGNPNLILVGQRLALKRCTDPPALLHLGSTYHAPAHRAASHAVRHAGKVWKVTYGYPYKCGDGDGDGYDVACHAATPAHRTYHRAAASGTYHGSGAMQQCIIRAESGGNSQVMNSSSHYGLYQFSYSTWVASGGSPSSFGHASVAEQNRVFYNAVAARGYSDWTPYDGC